MLIAVAVTAGVFTAATSTATTQGLTPKVTPKYWKLMGCSHGHKSTTAYERITMILRSNKRFTKSRVKKARHYVRCVATRAKSRAVRRHYKKQLKWRQAHRWIISLRQQWSKVPQWLKDKLRIISGCESGGDPGAVSPSGAYRGKYQFSPTTWGSVGGHGDPAAAPEEEQDVLAARLYLRSGPSQWPVCGV